MMKKTKTLFAAVLMTLSAGAFAHVDLVSSSPEDGAMLMTHPQSVDMTFGDEVRLVNVRLVNSANQPVSLDFERQMEPAASFSVPLPALSPETYTVQWIAIGEDGHKMNGSFGFMQH